MSAYGQFTKAQRCISGNDRFWKYPKGVRRPKGYAPVVFVNGLLQIDDVDVPDTCNCNKPSHHWYDFSFTTTQDSLLPMPTDHVEFFFVRLPEQSFWFVLKQKVASFLEKLIKKVKE